MTKETAHGTAQETVLQESLYFNGTVTIVTDHSGNSVFRNITKLIDLFCSRFFRCW